MAEGYRNDGGASDKWHIAGTRLPDQMEVPIVNTEDGQARFVSIGTRLFFNGPDEWSTNWTVIDVAEPNVSGEWWERKFVLQCKLGGRFFHPTSEGPWFCHEGDTMVLTAQILAEILDLPPDSEDEK